MFVREMCVMSLWFIVSEIFYPHISLIDSFFILIRGSSLLFSDPALDLSCPFILS